MRPMRLVWVVLFTVLIAAPAFAGEFSGQVVGVIDGDTIDVLHNGQAERIRLNGIDCPEKGRAYGQKAKHAASALVFLERSHPSSARQRQVRTHRCPVLLASENAVPLCRRHLLLGSKRVKRNIFCSVTISSS